MNKRENIISLYKRTGYENVPISFGLCPTLLEKYKEYTGDETGDYSKYFDFSERYIGNFQFNPQSTDVFKEYYDIKLREGTIIDSYGVAHMPGSEEAKHMTEMVCPMKNFISVEQMKDYPFPVFDYSNMEQMRAKVEKIKSQGYAASYGRAMTIWESSWYIRGMENLMCDMMTDDVMATYLLDKITWMHTLECVNIAKCGIDILHLGDDIGMQRTIMMSKELYRKWIKPRLTSLISSVKSVNPDVIIWYHSCGFIEPFIDDLIDAGVEVLNPIQPECMDFSEIHAKYGDRISFNGTLGTQTLFPFGTVEDIKNEVFKNLDIAGQKGGLMPTPSHVLEPEVPWENVLAYVQACKDYK